MFANTNLGVLNFAFPDVCKLLPIPIPFPFPNFALSFTHIPSVFNVIFGGGLAENLMTQGTISLGDISAGGVVSQIEMGPDRPLLGSFKVMVGVMFATRLTTMTMQNGMPPNAVGMSITPAQFRVILLS
ncbi:DUF4150 domain-containing protein [Paraburkholderia sediminicola]|uniref:PAAR-like domain-containing protein n=1 Tax=Paraburkholderia TaxID=1822464 RepID=UPI002478BEBD|nr:PAAR-like domain-containing protein [Paraburkholderia sp. D15]WGS52877.1 DUF4150 domain-containing protein [Paraburkholderia sp. D15]WKF61702.1 hypothetical protein HUO10_006234 [Paraburkholderia busanensis]